MIGCSLGCVFFDICLCECVCVFIEGQVFCDLVVVEYEVIGKLVIYLVCFVMQVYLGVEINYNFVVIDQEMFWIVGFFCLCFMVFVDMFLNFCDVVIGVGCWEVFGFDLDDCWVEVLGDCIYVVVIDGCEEVGEDFDVGIYGGFVFGKFNGLRSLVFLVLLWWFVFEVVDDDECGCGIGEDYCEFDGMCGWWKEEGVGCEECQVEVQCDLVLLDKG